MRYVALVLLPLVSGCLSFTNSYLEFTKLSAPKGVRFYVASVELSEDLRRLPVGRRQSAGYGERIRANLAKNRSDLFAGAPEGAIAVKVSISSHKSVVPVLSNPNANDAAFNVDGISGPTSMLIMSVTMWKLTYEIKCELDCSGVRQTVVKPVNSIGSSMESLLCLGIAGFFQVMFEKNAHFDGFELYYGAADQYDWLAEREFADVMASAVAEFDIAATDDERRTGAQ